MAKTALERKQDERTRNKLTKEERLTNLLSRLLNIDFLHNDDAKLRRSMQRAGIGEEQDLIKHPQYSLTLAQTYQH